MKKMLILMKPVAGTENRSDDRYIIGKKATPNASNIKSIRPVDKNYICWIKLKKKQNIAFLTQLIKG
jgi:hypothetical protein